MFDVILESSVRKKDYLKQKIDNLKDDISKLEVPWKELDITEAECGIIAACDGSYNMKKFRPFALYAVGAEVVIFDKALKFIKSSDLDVLYPYVFVEDRLRFYMNIYELKTDIIRPLPFKLNPNKETKKKIEDKYLDKLKEMVSNNDEIEIFAKRFYDEIKKDYPENGMEALSYLEYLESLLTLHELLEKHKDKLVAISKTSTSTTYFNSDVPDIAIFEQNSNKQGYSEPIYGEISEKLKRKFPILDQFFRNINFTIFYVRLEDRKNVLKFEIPIKLEDSDILELLRKLKKISVGGYPYLLKKAHKDVVIGNLNMNHLITMLGLFDKTGREML